MRAKFVYEKFTEDSDPISDLGIGIKELLKKWLKSINVDYINDNVALACSAAYGKKDFVEYLLQVGTNVHAGNEWALREASRNGRVEIVKMLLNAGANVHIDDDEILQYANQNGHTDVVKVLKDYIAKEKNKIKI